MLIHHSALVKPGVSNQRIPGKWGRESAIGTPDLGRGRLYVHPVEEQWMKNSVYRTDESKSREILGYTQPGDLLASAYLYNFKLLTVKLFVYCDRSSFMGLSKWRQPTDLFKSTTDPPKSQERDRAGKEFWMEPRKKSDFCAPNQNTTCSCLPIDTLCLEILLCGWASGQASPLINKRRYRYRWLYRHRYRYRYDYRWLQQSAFPAAFCMEHNLNIH